MTITTRLMQRGWNIDQSRYSNENQSWWTIIFQKMFLHAGACGRRRRSLTVDWEEKFVKDKCFWDQFWFGLLGISDPFRKRDGVSKRNALPNCRDEVSARTGRDSTWSWRSRGISPGSGSCRTICRIGRSFPSCARTQSKPNCIYTHESSHNRATVMALYLSSVIRNWQRFTAERLTILSRSSHIVVGQLEILGCRTLGNI